MSTTQQLAHWIAETSRHSISARALQFAGHAMLDGLGVMLAGANEPVTRSLTTDAMEHGEQGTVRLIGQQETVSPTFAALINGTAAHALDYDDINKQMRGHPTVTILPALLAVADSKDCSVQEVLEALVVGTETACIVGDMLGAEHYQQGFHTTATAGTLGAAAGVAHLNGLDETQVVAALGLAATQAAGLRCMFGSMAKPLHAGKAAMNGLLAARWAAAGITAHPAALESVQGFSQVHYGSVELGGIPTSTTQRFAIENNIYKYHAACYYTHSAIVALQTLLTDHPIEQHDIIAIEVYLLPSLLDVCDIPEPKTGLEIKFSIRHLMAMVMNRMDTSDIALYNAANAQDTELCRLRRLVKVKPYDFSSRTAATVILNLRGEHKHEKTLDAGIPVTDPVQQARHVSNKFMALTTTLIGCRCAESTQATIQEPGQSKISDLLTSINQPVTCCSVLQ